MHNYLYVKIYFYNWHSLEGVKTRSVSIEDIGNLYIFRNNKSLGLM